MRIVVIADEDQRAGWSKNVLENTGISWVAAIENLKENNFDAVIDLQFENNAQRLSLLSSFAPSLVIIGSVIDTLKETDDHFIRINHWNTFTEGTIIEAATLKEENKSVAEKVMSAFGKQIEWLHDDPGFIVPRVVCSIINEAYIAVAEEVSTKEAIDTAMKLGTSYPYGPFEWAQKIGIDKVSSLLRKLAKYNNRYEPSQLLIQAG